MFAIFNDLCAENEINGPLISCFNTAPVAFGTITEAKATPLPGALPLFRRRPRDLWSARLVQEANKSCRFIFFLSCKKGRADYCAAPSPSPWCWEATCGVAPKGGRAHVPQTRAIDFRFADGGTCLISLTVRLDALRVVMARATEPDSELPGRKTPSQRVSRNCMTASAGL